MSAKDMETMFTSMAINPVESVEYNHETRFVMRSLLDQTLIDAADMKGRGKEEKKQMDDYVIQMDSVDRPLKEQIIGYALRAQHAKIHSTLTEENVNLIVKYADGKHMFDAYARSGENASMLRAAGIEVFAVQERMCYSPCAFGRYNLSVDKPGPYIAAWIMFKTSEGLVSDSPVTLIKNYPFKNLLLTMDHPEGDARDILNAFNGTTLFYAGDCDIFHFSDSLFDLIEKEWELIDVQEKDPYLSEHDRLYVFRRNKLGGTRMPRYVPMGRVYFNALAKPAVPLTGDTSLSGRFNDAIQEAKVWWHKHKAQGWNVTLGPEELLPSFLADIVQKFPGVKMKDIKFVVPVGVWIKENSYGGMEIHSE